MDGLDQVLLQRLHSLQDAAAEPRLEELALERVLLGSQHCRFA